MGRTNEFQALDVSVSIVGSTYRLLKRHQRSFGNDYEAAVIYAERLKQEQRLKKLKGDNPLLDQIAHTSSGIRIKEVLRNYRSTKEPFLKPGTVEFYKYLENRLVPLSRAEVIPKRPRRVRLWD